MDSADYWTLGRIQSLTNVRISATRMLESLPVNTLITLPKYYSLGMRWSSLIVIKSSASKFCWTVSHLYLLCNSHTYSFFQRLANDRVLRRCHLFCRDKLSQFTSGTAIKAAPLNRWPGVKSANSFRSSLIGDNGLELSIISNRTNNVENSSKVN